MDLEEHLPFVKFHGTKSSNTVDYSSSSRVDLPAASYLNGTLLTTGGSGSYGPLATVEDVDFATADQTVLYTVPTGKLLVVTRISFRLSSIVNWDTISEANVSVGITPAFNSLVNGQGLSSFNVTGQTYILNISGVVPFYSAGDILVMDLTTAFTVTEGGSATVGIDVFGYTIDV